MRQLTDGAALHTRIEEVITKLDDGRADGTIYTYGQIQELLRSALAEAVIDLPADTETHERRRYTPAVCWLCSGQAAYFVEDENDDQLLACDEHKWRAFS